MKFIEKKKKPFNDSLSMSVVYNCCFQSNTPQPKVAITHGFPILKNIQHIVMSVLVLGWVQFVEDPIPAPHTGFVVRFCNGNVV